MNEDMMNNQEIEAIDEVDVEETGSSGKTIATLGLGALLGVGIYKGAQFVWGKVKSRKMATKDKRIEVEVFDSEEDVSEETDA